MRSTLRLVVIATLAAATVLGSAGTASAWTLLRNNYPNNPVGCDDNLGWPCIKWPLSGGVSTTVWVYIDPALGSTLTQDSLTAFSRWNAVPAKNPFLYRATSRSSATGAGYGSGYETQITWDEFLPADVMGGTSETTLHEIYGEGYDDNVIKTFSVGLNPLTAWNHNLDFSVVGGIHHADSRTVILHELGHGECRGHTGHTAIMNTSLHTIYTVQTDDIYGMQACYGAA